MLEVPFITRLTKKLTKESTQRYSYPLKRDVLVEPEVAEKLLRKLKRKKLNDFEINTLADYERPGIYKENDIGGKVLYVASGNDGIPACVYGDDRLISLDRLSRNIKSENIMGDMHAVPLQSGVIDTILIHNMDIFTDPMTNIGQGGLLVEKSLKEFYREMARVTKLSNSIMIITQAGGRRRPPSSEVLEKIKASGWSLAKQNESNVLNSYVLIKG